MKVLDTDVAVEALRANRRVLDRIAEDRDVGDLWTTIITAAELSYGAEKSNERDRQRGLVEVFVAEIRALPLTFASARTFGELKAQLEREGQKLADADLFIAAICLEHDAIIVTGNRRHFDRVPGLAIENWIDGSDA